MVRQLRCNAGDGAGAVRRQHSGRQADLQKPVQPFALRERDYQCEGGGGSAAATSAGAATGLRTGTGDSPPSLFAYSATACRVRMLDLQDVQMLKMLTWSAAASAFSGSAAAQARKAASVPESTSPWAPPAADPHVSSPRILKTLSRRARLPGTTGRRPPCQFTEHPENPKPESTSPWGPPAAEPHVSTLRTLVSKGSGACKYHIVADKSLPVKGRELGARNGQPRNRLLQLCHG